MDKCTTWNAGMRKCSANWRLASVISIFLLFLLLSLAWVHLHGAPSPDTPAEKPLAQTNAVEAAHKSAEAGSVDAMYKLATFYQAGQGVQRDEGQALNWYAKAADKGRADAMRRIGDLYSAESKNQQSYAEAVKWYRKASQAGDTEAMLDMGYSYE